MNSKNTQLLAQEHQNEGVLQQNNANMKSLTMLVVTICWLSIIAEGYDLSVYGVVLPSLLNYAEWSLTPVQAGLIGSYSLVGLLLGNVIVGTVTDIIGRKATIVFSVILFSVTMGLCALAPSPFWFGLFRFIGGLGLGGIVPTATAMTMEYTPPKQRSLTNAILLTGYPLGGVLGAIIAPQLIPVYGWKIMFYIGVIPLLLVPFIIKFLPKSIVFLLSRNRTEEAERIASRFRIPVNLVMDFEGQQNSKEANSAGGLKALFTRGNIRATIFFWVTLFLGLLMIYGLNTWLPEIMQKAGYSFDSSMAFFLTLNLSAAIGVVVGGAAADRWGYKRIIAIYYFFGAVSIALLSIKASLALVYVLVAIAGAGAISPSLMMTGYVSKYFPSASRATALGLAMGVGRLGAILGPIIGGYMIALQLPYIWSFYVFAICGLLALLATLLIPKHSGGKV